MCECVYTYTTKHNHYSAYISAVVVLYATLADEVHL